MKLRVLGCSGAEFPGHNTSAFLIDDTVLLDAGTVGAVLGEEDQFRLTDIFITHTHIDHIKGIPLLADNITLRQLDHTIRVISSRENVQAIRRHLLNDVIWPDFSKIPSGKTPVIEYVVIEAGIASTFGDYTVTAYPMNHSVPTLGYIIRKRDKALLYTGDTGPTPEIWKHAANLSAMIVEVSFPDEMAELARLTGHLTPGTLAAELKKLPTLPARILITHLKPQFIEKITSELNKLDIAGIEILTDGAEYIL